ncbi:MAG TPA: O-antigen ligase family protein [Bacilli bacterium]|nr:O-antigen ligase family protein [Bacilli bacterium]
MQSVLLKINALEKRDIVSRLFSISFYIFIVFFIAFEGHTSLSSLASYGLYFFILCGGVYLVVKRKVRFNYYIILMAMFGFVLLVSYLYTPNPAEAFSHLYRYFTLIVIVILAYCYLDSESRINFVMRAFMHGGVLLAFLFYLTYGADLIAQILGGGSLGRIGESLGNVNTVGMSTAISVFISFYFLLQKKSRFKILYIFIILVAFPIVFFTASKKALVILIMGVFFALYIAQSRRDVVSLFKSIFILVLVLFVSLIIFNQLPIFSLIYKRILNFILSLMSSAEGSLSDSHRIDMIIIGLTDFSKSPLFGRGIYSSYSLFETYSHNNYVEVLLSTGLVGFLIYYLSYVISFFFISKSTHLNAKLRDLLLFLLITIIIIEVSLVTYYSRYFHILLTTIAAATTLPKNIQQEGIDYEYSEENK